MRTPSLHDGQEAANSSALREAREAKNLSQEEMAARLGVSQATISRVESGQLSPRPRRIRAFAEHYGVPVDVFVPDEDEAAA